MSNDPFDSPASSVGIRWEELNGRLLLVTPLSKEAEIKTDYGVAEAIRANVVVLDGPDSPVEFRDTLIFPKVLQSQVRGNIGTGRANLGRLGQGNKKPGQSPPWRLADPTEDDKNVARSWYAGAPAKAAETEEREPATSGASAGGAKRPW